VTLLEVVRAVDPPPRPNGCLLGQQLCRGAECKLKELRQKVTRLVEEELSTTTLADFAVVNGFNSSPDEARRASG